MSVMAILRVCERHPGGRIMLFAIGVVMVMLSPLIGILPGPLGVPLFLMGATMMLRTSVWTKRLYVRMKRRWPRQGRWVDFGLRRASAKRRRARMVN